MFDTVLRFTVMSPLIHNNFRMSERAGLTLKATIFFLIPYGVRSAESADDKQCSLLYQFSFYR